MKKVAILTLLSGALFVGSSFIAQAGDVKKGAQLAGQCAACHAIDGNSTNPTWPKLAGQNEKYLIKQINDFRTGAKDSNKGRQGALMLSVWPNVSDSDVEDLAAYFASQQTQLGNVKKEFLDLGKNIYFQGDAERGIPACTACHGATGNGLASAGYPAISGQHPEYVINQLKNFSSAKRANDDNAVMRDIAVRMSDAQIEAVAQFMLGLH